MEKGLEILKHINELYKGDVSDEEMLRFAEKNSEIVNSWQEAFQNYELEDVLRIVDEYWTHKSNKTAPRVAQLLAMLNSDKDVKRVYSHAEEPIETKTDSHIFWNTDPALGYYLRDAETKPSEEVHALLFYRWALNDIIAEMVDTLPNADKMNFGQKVAIVRRNYWDADITDRVEQYARGAVKSSGSLQDMANTLASHWRM